MMIADPTPGYIEIEPFPTFPQLFTAFLFFGTSKVMEIVLFGRIFLVDLWTFTQKMAASLPFVSYKDFETEFWE